ncbi:hypothetical protein BDR05DRAFT_966395 [Suillus weaverae]|nr:hypothetical protein BDR05DRAFT_966395 [Suillus weaverae]
MRLSVLTLVTVDLSRSSCLDSVSITLEYSRRLGSVCPFAPKLYNKISNPEGCGPALQKYYRKVQPRESESTRRLVGRVG